MIRKDFDEFPLYAQLNASHDNTHTKCTNSMNLFFFYCSLEFSPILLFFENHDDFGQVNEHKNVVRFEPNRHEEKKILRSQRKKKLYMIELNTSDSADDFVNYLILNSMAFVVKIDLIRCGQINLK